jgi:peptide/nickel transport system substrate-binding protein
MQPTPFLTALKTAAFAILCFLVWMAFWQRLNLEEKSSAMTREVSALTDRVGDLSRKVDDLKSKADRLEGAADAMAQMVASGAVVGTGGPAPRVPRPTRQWGWEANAGLDGTLDPERPVGTPGRYRNYLTLDPDPIPPPASEGHRDGESAQVLGSQPKTFNPIINTAASIQESVELYVCDSPATEHWADPYQLTPRLCWRVEVSPDHREYTLFFRRDAVWQPAGDVSQYPHLGGTRPVTAKDYKFTIDTIMNPQTECAPLRAYYSDCEGVEVVDDWTAVVRWKKTVYHSISYTLVRRLVPEHLYAYDEQGVRFPEETFAQQFNDHYYNRVGMLGCGPYRMLPYDGGEWVTLERWEDWYGAREGRSPAIRRNRLLVYNDPETPFLKLKAGELSILGLTPSHWKRYVRDETDSTSPFKDGRIVNYRGMRPTYYFFAWKNTHPLFRDVRVRRALALAFNRDVMFEKIWLNLLVPMASVIYPGSPAADTDLKPMPYDPEEAARLLDEAGWVVNPESGIREKTVDGTLRRFEFKLMWNAPQAEMEATINQYRNDLRALGIALTPEPLEWSVYLEKLHDRSYEAAQAGWGTDSWDQDFEQVWHSRQIDLPKSSNTYEYSNPEVDRLSDDLRVEMDLRKRKEKAQRIARLIYEDQPVCLLGWVNVYGAHWAWYHNAVEHAYKVRPFIRITPTWVSR